MKIPFSLVELIGEWTISSFAGIVVAYLCLAAGAPFYITAAFAGVAGHMGGRAIELLERRVSGWLGGKGR
ncbi:LydA holin phage, holin superfamily III [compost metagenome]